MKLCIICSGQVFPVCVLLFSNSDILWTPGLSHCVEDGICLKPFITLMLHHCLPIYVTAFASLMMRMMFHWSRWGFNRFKTTTIKTTFDRKQDVIKWQTEATELVATVKIEVGTQQYLRSSCVKFWFRAWQHDNIEFARFKMNLSVIIPHTITWRNVSSSSLSCTNKWTKTTQL